MVGGGFSGLTSQTFCPLYCGSDRISLRNPARPHTSDRYGQVNKIKRLRNGLTTQCGKKIVF